MDATRLRSALGEIESASEELAEKVESLSEEEAFRVLEATLRLTVAAEILMGAIQRIENPSADPD